MSDDTPTVPPTDELGDLRNARTDGALDDKAGAEAVDAIDSMVTAVQSQKRVQAFMHWQQENLPQHEFSHHANELAGGLVGVVIGAWCEAGATPELIKEYFARCVDLVYAQCKAIDKPAS